MCTLIMHRWGFVADFLIKSLKVQSLLDIMCGCFCNYDTLYSHSSGAHIEKGAYTTMGVDLIMPHDIIV